jgi:hypothetical protein
VSLLIPVLDVDPTKWNFLQIHTRVNFVKVSASVQEKIKPLLNNMKALIRLSVRYYENVLYDNKIRRGI